MNGRETDATAVLTAQPDRNHASEVPRPSQIFTCWRQLKAGQVVFDRVKELPCMVIRALGAHAIVVRPGGQPWEAQLRRLSPGTEYHCRQLDALARHVAHQRRGEKRPH